MNINDKTFLVWWVLLALAVIVLVGLFISVVILLKLKRFKKAYTALQTYVSGNNMEQLLQEYLEKVKILTYEVEKCQKRLVAIETRIAASVDRVELIRFNAFENMGSDLSFALALLNEKGDGVVLSSIHNREETRVYAKPVVNGQSGYHLSEEEQQVIAKALNKNRFDAWQ